MIDIAEALAIEFDEVHYVSGFLYFSSIFEKKILILQVEKNIKLLYFR